MLDGAKWGLPHLARVTLHITIRARDSFDPRDMVGKVNLRVVWKNELVGDISNALEDNVGTNKIKRKLLLEMSLKGCLFIMFKEKKHLILDHKRAPRKMPIFLLFQSILSHNYYQTIHMEMAQTLSSTNVLIYSYQILCLS